MFHKIRNLFKRTSIAENLGDKVTLNFLVGDRCEKQVLGEIAKFLKTTFQIEDKLASSFVLSKVLNKCRYEDKTEAYEIDILVVHPLLGIYFLEVKYWSKEFFEKNKRKLKYALEKLKRNADCFMNRLQAEFPTLPLKVNHKLIFCGEDADKYVETLPEGWKLKITTLNRFRRNPAEIFEIQTAPFLDEEVFKKILDLLEPVDKRKDLIKGFFVSSNGIYVIDKISAQILKNYQGGLKIVRGVAGTGKSFILLEFAKANPNKNKLIFCFNKELATEFEELLEEDKTVKVYRLLSFIYKNVKPKLNSETLREFEIRRKGNFDEFMKFLGSNTQIITAFKEALRDFVKKFRINYILIDEAQDFPPQLLRAVYDAFENTIIFIDEGQKINSFGVSDIKKDVFKNISLHNKVTNLKLIYRTPAKIAEKALRILSQDEQLNAYYKKAYYILNSLTEDLKFILPGGELFFFKQENEAELIELLKSQKDSFLILTISTKQRKSLKNKFDLSEDQIKTIASVKGLEADNVVILGLKGFLAKNIEKDSDIFYRKLYVLLTRARKRLFIEDFSPDEIDFKSDPKGLKKRVIKTVYDILAEGTPYWKPQREETPEEEINPLFNTFDLKLNNIDREKIITKVKESLEVVANLSTIITTFL